MSYLALYRQWRPQLLGELVGQGHVSRTLRNAVKAGKVSHAYLFCGPRGTGKTSTAKVLARAVNCPDQRDGEPCNRCRTCLDIVAGSTMDVVEIDAASNRGIDEIRELKENIKFLPSRASRRVYIVDEVHMLTNEAFNALLKTLEEPPGHVVFVLATTEPHKVPLTILSRCQRFDFRPIADELIAGRLQEVAAVAGFTLDDGAVGEITRAAGGSLRDALSVVDQALLMSEGGAITAETVHGILGTVREESLQGLAAAIARNDAAAVLALVDDIASAGHDLNLMAGGLTEYLRGLLLAMLAPEGAGKTPGPARTAQTPLRLFSRDGLLRAIDLLVHAEQSMRRSAHPRVVLEVALVRAAEGDFPPAGSELLARLERLEKALADHNEGGFSGCGEAGNNYGARPGRVPHPMENHRAAPTVIPGSNDGTSESKAANKGTAALVRAPAMNKPSMSNFGPTAKTLNGSDGHGQPGPGIGDKDMVQSPAAGSAEESPGTAVNSLASFEIEQIRKWWPDILSELKRVDTAKYTYLSLAWPAEVKDGCLVLGVPAGDEFVMQMVGDEANRALLVKTLRAFTRADWTVRCSYSDAPPPEWEGRQADLQPDEAISLFQGEEVSPPGDLDKN